MGDPATIALYLTFFGTLGLAFLMFLGLFVLVILTLVIAGVGRLLALTVMALFGRLPRNESLPLVRLTGDAAPPSNAPAAPAHDAAAATPRGKPASAGVPRAAGLLPRLRHAMEQHPLLTAVRREPPALAPDWAAAVAEADARAMARARAAAPALAPSVSDLPAPPVPAAKVEAVAPLVESALQQDKRGSAGSQGGHPGREAARSFTKPPAPAPLSPLDTGSLVSLSGPAKVLKAKLPADRR